jgi:hypothetical protein
VDGDPEEVAIHKLDLAGMGAGSDLDAELPRLHKTESTSDGARGCIERRDKFLGSVRANATLTLA